MSVEELEITDAKDLPIGKLISIIFKGQSLYLNRKLDALGINATQLHLLFEIYNQNEINQECIASRCNINKGSVARSIKKLEDKDIIIREIDAKNRRQNKISLTKKGQDILDRSIDMLDLWEDKIFEDNELMDKETLQKVLKKMAIKISRINEMEIKDE